MKAKKIGCLSDLSDLICNFKRSSLPRLQRATDKMTDKLDAIPFSRFGNPDLRPRRR